MLNAALWCFSVLLEMEVRRVIVVSSCRFQFLMWFRRRLGCRYYFLTSFVTSFGTLFFSSTFFNMILPVVPHRAVAEGCWELRMAEQNHCFLSFSLFFSLSIFFSLFLSLPRDRSGKYFLTPETWTVEYNYRWIFANIWFSHIWRYYFYIYTILWYLKLWT